MTGGPSASCRAGWTPEAGSHFFYLAHALSRLGPNAAAPTGDGALQSQAPAVRFVHATHLGFEAQEVFYMPQDAPAAAPGSAPGALRPNAGRMLTPGSDAGAAAYAAPTLASAILGLTGTVSPLPQTLWLALDDPDLPAPLTHFLHAVHHRLLALLVLRYVQAHPALCLQRHYQDVWSRRLLAWTPVAPDVAIADKWRYLAALMRPCRSAEVVTGIVADALHRRNIAADVHLTPMTGGFVRLDAHQSCALGNAQHALGHASVMGAHARAAHSAFALTIAPRTGEDCRRLWQDPSAAKMVEDLMGLLGPLEARCDVWAIRHPDMAQHARLDQTAHLGASAWLGATRKAIRVPFFGPKAAAKRATHRPMTTRETP